MAGLEAVYTAVGGGNPDGATAVGTEGYGQETGSDGVCRASRRATGVIMGVVRIERRPLFRIIVCRI